MPCFTLPSCLPKIILNSLPSFLRRKYFKTIPNCLSYKVCCLTDPTFSLSIFHQMILLVLAKTAAILKISSINTKRTAIFLLPCLPSTTYFPEAKLSSTFLPSIFWKYSKTLHQQPENIRGLFRLQIVLAANHQHPKTFKDFFCCKIVLATNHQPCPGNIQRLFGQQSTTAISSSNQQQQPAAATSSSNQQQQSAAAINSSNQQQQPAAAINSRN